MEVSTRGFSLASLRVLCDAWIDGGLQQISIYGDFHDHDHDHDHDHYKQDI